MKFRLLQASLIIALLMSAPVPLAAQPATPAVNGSIGPRLTFATNRYDFGKITGGTKVKYTYLLTNTGDQALEISSVTPGCHCTTAGDWTHHVAPGQAGSIPMQFDSGNASGGVTRTITVTSNDRLAPRQTLSLTGTIWRPFTISPQFAYLTIRPDGTANTPAFIRITSQADEPVTLSNPTSATSSFAVGLKTIRPGKEFEVIITALPPLPSGNTVGRISLQTSETNMPLLTITTIAVRPPVPRLPQTTLTNPPTPNPTPAKP